MWMMLVGLGLTILMLSVTLLFGAGLQAVTGMPLPLLVLAFVPGGLAEMSLVALALTDDPAFVATNHIVRIGLVVVFASWLFRLYRRRLEAAAGLSVRRRAAGSARSRPAARRRWGARSTAPNRAYRA